MTQKVAVLRLYVAGGVIDGQRGDEISLYYRQDGTFSLGTEPRSEEHWDAIHCVPRGVWHLGRNKRAFSRVAHHGAWEVEYTEKQDLYGNRQGVVLGAVSSDGAALQPFIDMIHTLQDAGAINRRAASTRPDTVQCQDCGVDVPVGSRGRLPTKCPTCRGMHAERGIQGALIEDRRLHVRECLGCGSEYEAIRRTRYSYCDPCRNDGTARADGGMRKRYGIGLRERLKLNDVQKGKCAICAGHLSDFTECLDHDHETSRARGLLCQHCNRALGTFGDDLNGVMRVIEYLKNPPASIFYKGVDEPYVHGEAGVEKM